ncbi:LADA_0H00540g1_1 [Lachancea dasiensis]|uniref:Protein PBN1 n=1 Tax=Lachancea dasiensis TaxID=1072105 RepID=A0A1G4JYT6_9SACH|nr:LADA_0H00540g1_1 [Lachancea dasiensis]
MSTRKTRVTVLFNDLEELERAFADTPEGISSSSSIVITGSNQWVQHRTTIGLPNHFEPLRITWKATKPLNYTLQAPLMEGMNIYSSKSSQHPSLANSISSAKYNLMHSEAIDEALIREILPVEIAGINFTINEDRHYDILLDRQTLKIDEYYALDVGKTQNISYSPELGKFELGLFFPESNNDLEVNLNGARCSWTDDGVMEQCKKTYLFYQRAHFAPIEADSYPVRLLEPVGLHPTVSVDLTNAEMVEKCAFYMYLTTPADLFMDKFDTSPIFLAGATDLEAPEYRIVKEVWGMESLLELTPGMVNDVKLHTRYVLPQSVKSSKSVRFTPHIFQACDSGSDSIHENPFYTKSLGFDSLFTNDTIFKHFNTPTLELAIPAADSNDYEFVRSTTWACLIISVLYLCLKILRK